MLKHRSIYRVKREFLSTLKDLSGLEIISIESETDVMIKVTEYHATVDYLTCFLIPAYGLPKSSDSKLVHALLEQVEKNKLHPADVFLLKEYLCCAKNNDNNNEIKSNLMESIKKIIIGLFSSVIGIAGFLLTFFLMVSLSVELILLIPILVLPLVVTVLAVTWGALNLAIGLFKLSVGIFSVCFSIKNVEMLLILQDKLAKIIDQNQLPTYQEAIRTMPTASAPPAPQPVLENTFSLISAAESSSFASIPRKFRQNQFFQYSDNGGIEINTRTTLQNVTLAGVSRQPF